MKVVVEYIGGVVELSGELLMICWEGCEFVWLCWVVNVSVEKVEVVVMKFGGGVEREGCLWDVWDEGEVVIKL